MQHRGHGADLIHRINGGNALGHIGGADNHSVALAHTVCQHTGGAGVYQIRHLVPGQGVVIIIKAGFIAALGHRFCELLIHGLAHIILGGIFDHENAPFSSYCSSIIADPSPRLNKRPQDFILNL